MSSCWPIKGEHIEPQYTYVCFIRHTHMVTLQAWFLCDLRSTHTFPDSIFPSSTEHTTMTVTWPTAPAPFCSVPHNAAIFNCCDPVMNCECFGFPFSLRTILGTGHNKFLREKKLAQKILELSSGLWPISQLRKGKLHTTQCSAVVTRLTLT